MRALSIRQPWVWAILTQGKDIENRNWGTSFRGRFAIHAAKGVTKDEYESGICHISSIRRRLVIPDFEEIIRGAIVGVAEIADCVTFHDSAWFEGEYGFLLRDVVALPEPIPCKGALNFWDVPADIVAQIEEQLRRK